MSDRLDDLVRASIPKVAVTPDRAERVMAAVMAGLAARPMASPARPVWRRLPGDLVVRYVVPMAMAAGLALMVGPRHDPVAAPQLSALIMAANVDWTSVR
jgi:hypothetical protein